MTYFDGWKIWMKRGNKAKNTLEGYIRDVEQLLMFLFGTIDDQSPSIYSMVDSDKIYEFFDEKEFGPATIGRKISSMRCFYSYLIKDKKILKDNPFDGMVRPAVPKPRPKALSEEETLDILNAAYAGKYVNRNGMRDYAIITIFATVPVRKSEIQDLKRSDYTEDGILIIREAKGMKNREIPCTADMIMAIDDYLDSRNDDCEYLFISEQKNRMSAHAMDNVIHKYANNINPHALRSTSATNMFRNGVPIATIKEIGGWDQGSNTFEKTYLKIDNKIKRNAIEEAMQKMKRKKD